MANTRVLVVEDSRTVGMRIIDALSPDPEIDVVGAAQDGRRGIELCQSLRPDVVTLDMTLPTMDGLAATEFIMARCPTPILIVSASSNPGDVLQTYEALAAGAVEVLEKPVGSEGRDEWVRKLISTVKLIARIKVITRTRPRPSSLNGPPRTTSMSGGGAGLRIIALGASTGGPQALLEILTILPANFPLPILLVLHIGPLFAPTFAEWIRAQCLLKVSVAQDGDALPPLGTGQIMMAPADRHMVLEQGKVRLNRDSPEHSCRPSVDVLFRSVAREMGPRSAGCLLTGMGKDGAEGLLAMRRAGATTLVQDQRTSVVFGMPAEAIRLGAAQRVLPLEDIGRALVAWARS